MGLLSVIIKLRESPWLCKNWIVRDFDLHRNWRRLCAVLCLCSGSNACVVRLTEREDAELRAHGRGMINAVLSTMRAGSVPCPRAVVEAVARARRVVRMAREKES